MKEKKVKKDDFIPEIIVCNYVEDGELSCLNNRNRYNYIKKRQHRNREDILSKTGNIVNKDYILRREIEGELNHE